MLEIKKYILPILTMAYWAIVGVLSFEGLIAVLNARIQYPIIFAIITVALIISIAAQLYKRIVKFVNSEIRKL